MEFLFKERNDLKIFNCVYQIKNTITKKIYVGSTTNLKKRIINHYNLLNNKKHNNKKLQNSWNKYGEMNFIVIVIEENINKVDLLNREQFYINFFNSYKNGYNILPIAGTTLGNKWTDDSKNKYSKLKKSLNLGEPVIQYDLNGNKLNEFLNMKIAALSIGLKNASNIGMVCRKERKTFGGFIWEYKNSEKQKKYGKIEFKKKIKCPHCNSENTKKSGFLRWKENEKQIYKCNSCKKRFNQGTNSLSVWEKNIERNKKIVELFKNNGYDIIEISKKMNVSKLTVKRVIKKYIIDAKI